MLCDDVLTLARNAGQPLLETPGNIHTTSARLATVSRYISVCVYLCVKRGRSTGFGRDERRGA